MTERRKPGSFRLPMTAAFLTYTNGEGKGVAHALDFDLVSVADTKEQALAKLRVSVSTYIEYGLNHNFAGDIRFPAPDDFWKPFFEHRGPVGLLSPIQIEDNRLAVVSAVLDDGPRKAA